MLPSRSLEPELYSKDIQQGGEVSSYIRHDICTKTATNNYVDLENTNTDTTSSQLSRRQITAKRTMGTRVKNPYKKNILKRQNLQRNVLTKYSVDTESTIIGTERKSGANCVEKNMSNDDDDAHRLERKEPEQHEQEESKINSAFGTGNEYIYLQCNNASKLFEEVENEDERSICSPQSATTGTPIYQRHKSPESETGINRMKETNSIFANLQDLAESDLDAFLEE